MKDIKNITIEAVDYGYIVKTFADNILAETRVFETHKSLSEFISGWAYKKELCDKLDEAKKEGSKSEY